MEKGKDRQSELPIVVTPLLPVLPVLLRLLLLQPDTTRSPPGQKPSLARPAKTGGMGGRADGGRRGGFTVFQEMVYTARESVGGLAPHGK